MVKVGMVGCGGIANAHAAGWKETAAAGSGQVAALCDVSAANLDKLEQSLETSGLPRFDNWEQMLAEADVDAIDICLPHHLHAPAILAAARAGKHVLCEKPLCMTLDEAAQIRDAIEASGVTLMCAHNQLFLPAVRHMRAEIEKGTIGRLQMVLSQECFRLDRTKEEWGWRGPLATSGGGVLIDTGYHPTYRLLYLAGSEARLVTSMTNNYHCQIEGEDVAHVLVRFENDVLGHIITSWAFPLPPGGWQVMVYGSEGAMFGRGNQFVHKPYQGEGSEQTLPNANGFAEEVKHFCAALAEGSQPIQTHVDGINVLKLILGAYEAQQTGRTVSL